MSRPNILVLGLMNEDYIYELFEHLMSSMRAVATVKLVTGVKEATTIISSNSPPDAVLSIDAAPMKSKHRSLNEQLVRYAKAGGTVVFGCNFSNRFSFGAADSFFRAWCVPWSLGDYHRTTVYLNGTGVPGMNLTGLDPSYSVKALNLAKILPNSAIYSPSRDSRTQSHVFPATAVDTSQTPAAYSAIGDGYMGYTGDVNAEEPTTKVIMAMLHLPINHLGPNTTDKIVGVTFGPGGVLPEITRQSGSTTRTPTASAGGRAASFFPGTNKLDDSDSESFDSSAYDKSRSGTDRGIPPRITTHVSRPREAEVKARALRRNKVNERKKAAADKLKDKGNNVFKAGNYKQAVELYKQACKTYKPLPVYMSNLAAALIKLERWDEAEMAADHATLVDPKLLKGYFRRGVARRHYRKLNGSIRDFERCLAMDPKCADFRTELKAAKQERDAEYKEDGRDDKDGYDVDSDYEAKLVFNLGRDFAPDRTVHVLDCPSDSEAYQHKGKGKGVKLPCRYYNHDGCQFGKVCRYKHAPDDRSIRDELGRNVCLHYLIDRCIFGDRCWYAHEKTYLPSNGWWNEENLGGWQELYDCVKEDMEDGVFDRVGSAMNGTADIWRIRENLDLLVDDWTNAVDDGSQGYSDDDDFYGTGTAPGRGGRENRLEGEMDERADNMGFTEDEVHELLCQGVKPWDNDAWVTRTSMSNTR
ncbi:hypothetical protein J3R30DRAFT_3445981 [Lentinula aciculospora]|uniref:C3H1-type domain-containing protein n=1 Tax=Lentinula aciculospora TaxID=153920 RepID=A0A9W9AP65_9AGAR|nr:hypothetical protein J3R30DRAFT_3445981 [Lentinula aciculospora]